MALRVGLVERRCARDRRRSTTSWSGLALTPTKTSSPGVVRQAAGPLRHRAAAQRPRARCRRRPAEPGSRVTSTAAPARSQRVELGDGRLDEPQPVGRPPEGERARQRQHAAPGRRRLVVGVEPVAHPRHPDARGRRLAGRSAKDRWRRSPCRSRPRASCAGGSSLTNVRAVEACRRSTDRPSRPPRPPGFRSTSSTQRVLARLAFHGSDEEVGALPDPAGGPRGTEVAQRLPALQVGAIRRSGPCAGPAAP